MKWMLPLPVWLAALTLASLGLPACGQDAEPVESSTTERELGPIRPDEARILLDRVKFGGKRDGRFVLRNQSDQEQVISRVGPASCSCTSLFLAFPEREGQERIELTGSRQDILVRANETVHVEVTFDTSRLRRPVSRRTDGFAVLVEGAPGEVLEYSIDVWTPFWVEPWSLDLGKVGVREKPTGFVAVKDHDAQEFELIVPDEVDGWQIRMQRFEGTPSRYNVHFEAPDELPYGPFSFRVPMTTDLEDSPELEVVVMGVAVGDLDWGPKKATLFPDANGQAKQKFWLASRAPERPLGLRNIILEGFPEEFSVPSLRVVPTTVEAEHSYAIEVELLQAPRELLEGHLVLITDDVDQPRIRIPLTIRPSR